MVESTERELYSDLRAITGHQKSKFLLYFESSCIVITRSRKLARVITSKSVVKNSMLPTAAINKCSMMEIFNQEFGSKLAYRSMQSTRVLAAWLGLDGEIDETCNGMSFGLIRVLFFTLIEIWWGIYPFLLCMCNLTKISG